MSQIVRHLTIIVLLLKIRLNSSASIMRMESLTPQESSMQTTGSSVTSYATLTGSLLSGYLTEITYTDATCSAVRYSEMYPLNVCFPWITGSSYYAMCNGTHNVILMYSDYSCSILQNSFIFSQSLLACDQDFSSGSVTASYPTIVSSAALLSAA